MSRILITVHDEVSLDALQANLDYGNNEITDFVYECDRQLVDDEEWAYIKKYVEEQEIYCTIIYMSEDKPFVDQYIKTR